MAVDLSGLKGFFGVQARDSTFFEGGFLDPLISSLATPNLLSAGFASQEQACLRWQLWQCGKVCGMPSLEGLAGATPFLVSLYTGRV